MNKALAAVLGGLLAGETIFFVAPIGTPEAFSFGAALLVLDLCVSVLLYNAEPA